jgi:hypothetical protein
MEVTVGHGEAKGRRRNIWKKKKKKKKFIYIYIYKQEDVRIKSVGKRIRIE